MKSTIYKIAALTFAVASMSACSLDEYNPSQKQEMKFLQRSMGLKDYSLIVIHHFTGSYSVSMISCLWLKVVRTAG